MAHDEGDVPAVSLGAAESAAAGGFRADGCRVFAGMAQARPNNLESLGDEISHWLHDHPHLRIVHIETRLQPAEGFVWLTVIIFYLGAATPRRPRPSEASSITLHATGPVLDPPETDSQPTTSDNDSDEFRLQGD